MDNHTDRTRHRASADGPARIDRRKLVKGIGAAMAAAAGTGALAGNPSTALAAALQRRRPFVGGGLPRQPNILLLLTDQERSPQWWPEGWADANLPNRKRLADRGLSFRRAYCSAAMCSPSRATLFTGQYPVQHGMTFTLSEGGTSSPCEPTLRQDVTNMGQMLRRAGYDVQYRGKWHLSKGPAGGESTTEQLADYGFDGWQPPEAAQDTRPENYGGGCANRDEPYAQQAADWLRNEAPGAPSPFFMVASFGNPHDVLAYPSHWDQETEPGCFNYRPFFPELFEQGIELPPTYDEHLATNFKPRVQVELKAALARLGLILTAEQARNYANFYAFLHQVVDGHIGTVLDALEADQEVFENTIVIRLSDHGEMGMSHGGLRQKAFNVYEESINVPLTFSNPLLFPQPVETDAFATLIDIMPTLASMAYVPGRGALPLRGKDLTPILLDAMANPAEPVASVQDSVLFTFDDENASSPEELVFPSQPKNIRCLRDERYKLALYFDPWREKTSEHELYDLWVDPMELNNLAHPDNPDYDPALTASMQTLLTRKMNETDTHPDRGRVLAYGRVRSAAGSFLADPVLEGFADFSINGRNPRSRSGRQTGDVRFRHEAADIDFRSDRFEALWVAGSTARGRGRGRINGEGEHAFRFWLRGAGSFGEGSVDVLRLQIFASSSPHGALLYDDELGEGSDCRGTPLLSGSIQIRS